MAKAAHALLGFLAITLLGASLPTDALATVCRLRGLSGFDDSAERAKKILPPGLTTDPRKAMVYIESTAEGPYFHSNFKTPGADYPTKIGREAIDSGALAFVNIVHDTRPTDKQWKATEEVFRENVQVFLDKSMFDENGAPRIDLEGVKNVFVVDGKAGQTLVRPSSGMEMLPRNEPPPLIMSKIAGCCFYGIPPQNAGRYQQALKSRQLKTSDVKFVSLVKDSATESAIASSASVKARRLVPDKPITTIADLEPVFKKAAGSTLVLIGHVEGDRFVSRDAKGTVSFSLPITEVRAAAKRNSVELIDLGCRTAQEIREDTMGVGVATRFNSADAVKSLDRALANSRNYAEFFENLTSDGLKVVVDHAFVAETSLHADVYSRQKTSASPLWVKVADLFVTLRGK